MIPFNNTYINLPSDFYAMAAPAHFPAPKILAYNEALAAELGIEIEEQDLAQIFSGQKIESGAQPIALAYAGFQFGHPVAQLGDGRALLLGEANGFDIQLKGSGQTPFSRRGDGRSALGPVLREYLVSEAMHALGVPSTRALAAVSTGETVHRQFGPEPGGIFTRVASSHIRVGTFQYFAFKQDNESLQTLLDYTTKRHYPELTDHPQNALELLKEFTKKQAELIAKWMGLGFIHGVMNTDNFSLAGITIDYGPCAFMDEFKADKVFSSIDQNGRYAYSNQIQIAKWNILRLADCLLPLIHEEQDKAVAQVEESLFPLFSLFEQRHDEIFAAKLGVEAQETSLIQDFLNYIEEENLDFTLSFRNLTQLAQGDKSFYNDSPALQSFLNRWNPDISKLDQINPIYIPRNHMVQRAIDRAYENDFSFFEKLLQIITNPFTQQADAEEFTLPPTREERVYKTYCGT